MDGGKPNSESHRPRRVFKNGSKLQSIIGEHMILSNSWGCELEYDTWYIYSLCDVVFFSHNKKEGVQNWGSCYIIMYYNFLYEVYCSTCFDVFHAGIVV